MLLRHLDHGLTRCGLRAGDRSTFGIRPRTRRRVRFVGMSSDAGVAAEQETAASTTSAPAPSADPLVQWVVLRKDLWGEIGWPLGPVIAQACHASSAALFCYRDDPQTQSYTSPASIDHMHKVQTQHPLQLLRLCGTLIAAAFTAGQRDCPCPRLPCGRPQQSCGPGPHPPLAGRYVQPI